MAISNLTLIYTIYFLDTLIMQITVPIFAQQTAILGIPFLLMESINFAMETILGPIIGSWCDLKDPKTVLGTTLLICCGCFVPLGTTKSLIYTLILRTIIAAFRQTQSICRALIADIVTDEDTSAVFGRTAALGSLAYLLGITITPFIMDVSNIYSHVCSLASIVFAINIGLVLQLGPSVEPIGSTFSDENISVHDQFFIILNQASYALIKIEWGHYWVMLVIRFLYGLSVSMYVAVLSYYLKAYFNLSQRKTEFVAAYLGVINTASAFLLQAIINVYYSDEHQSKQLYHFAIVLTFSLIFMCFSSNILTFLLILIPFAFCLTFLRIITIRYMLHLIKDGKVGSLTGAFNSIMSIARFISLIITKPLCDKFGEYTAMFISVIPVYIAAIICILFVPYSVTHNFNDFNQSI